MCNLSCVSISRPGFGRQLVDLPIGGRRQACEDVAQVREGIEPTPSATLNYGVQDGAALAGFGLADEQPVLFAQRRGPDGIFHEVLIDLHATVVKVIALAR
jgi:hypothetical protein